MPTTRESICCKKISVIDNKLQESSVGNPCCITEHEGFQPVCRDVWVLQTVGFQTQQEFERNATSGPVYTDSIASLYVFPHIQGPSSHGLLATTKVVLGYLGRNVHVVTFVCSL